MYTGSTGRSNFVQVPLAGTVYAEKRNPGAMPILIRGSLPVDLFPSCPRLDSSQMRPSDRQKEDVFFRASDLSDFDHVLAVPYIWSEVERRPVRIL
jgi:hypothetical protein